MWVDLSFGIGIRAHVVDGNVAKILSINRSEEDRGSTVVKALLYKSEGRWFDSSWCQFFIDISFRSHYAPGVDSASNRNEYQEHFLGVKAAGA